MKICEKNYLCGDGTCMDGGKCEYEKCEHWKPWTNFDKIKAMSVEKMAEFIDLYMDTYWKCDFCTPLHGGTFVCESGKRCDYQCEIGIKKWLNSEVEE